MALLALLLTAIAPAAQLSLAPPQASWIYLAKYDSTYDCSGNNNTKTNGCAAMQPQKSLLDCQNYCARTRTPAGTNCSVFAFQESAKPDKQGRRGCWFRWGSNFTWRDPRDCPPPLQKGCKPSGDTSGCNTVSVKGCKKYEDAAVQPHKQSVLGWVDGAAFVQNSGWNASVHRSPYARLPLAAKTGEWCSPPCPVRAPVWGEGQNGAGLYLAFKTDAPTVALNATLISEAREYVNCGVACQTGVDMYAHDTNSSAWRWVATAWPGPGGWAWSGKDISKVMVPTDAVLPSRGMTRYRIHLPIYNGFTSAAIKVPAGSTVAPDPPPPDQAAPILFYGTSIVNGHVASRPGMIFTHVLSRMLGRVSSFETLTFISRVSESLFLMLRCEWLQHAAKMWAGQDVINLGFGGQGTMDPSIGRLIAELKQVRGARDWPLEQ